MAQVNTNSTGQSLFIVDRDWLKQGPKVRKSWTGNVRNRSLYGLAIQVTEYDVPERIDKRKAKPKSKRRRLDEQNEARGGRVQSKNEQDVEPGPSMLQAEPNVHAFDILDSQSVTTTNRVGSVRNPASDASWYLNQNFQPPTNYALPGFEKIKGLECYLDYCK